MMKFYKEAKEEGKVLTGVVKVLKHDETKNTDVLIVDMVDNQVLIERGEVNVGHEGSLLDYMGKEVDFVVIKVDEEESVVYGSRKAVQVKERKVFAEEMKETGAFEAEIVNFTRFGAFVKYKNFEGLLKNIYFSDDHTSIQEIHEIGDKIEVKLLKITDAGRFLFEASNKYSRPTVIDFSLFESGQFILGKVSGIKTWGVFVNIAPGVDTLCSLPHTMELEEGMQVVCRITQVRKDEGRVRANIMRVLSPDDEDEDEYGQDEITEMVKNNS